MPTKPSSKGLKTFISSVKSELTGSILNKTNSNLPTDEQEALKSLVTLQRMRKIVIKPCDKGAGVLVVLNPPQTVHMNY